MADLLTDFVEYFKAKSMVSGDGIDAFRDKSPASPDDCLYMLEYRGRSFGLGTFGVRWVQFNYRSSNYSIARNKCTQIFKLFGVREEDEKLQITATRWAIVHCTGSPFKSTVDAQGRTVFTFNARVFTYFE